MMLESFLQNSTGSNINELLESLLQEQKKLLQSIRARRVMVQTSIILLISSTGIKKWRVFREALRDPFATNRLIVWVLTLSISA